MVFGFFEQPSWTPDRMPDLTSANTGIGYETTLALAQHGAKVYMACRTKTRVDEAMNKIKQIVKEPKLEFLNLDITKLNSAHSAALNFLNLESRLDILINNAGICTTPYELSEDGIELQACNSIGHFAFTIPLLSILIKTSENLNPNVRIVNVASNAHLTAWNPNFSSLESLNRYSYGSFGRYSNSKLANILFTNELQKKLIDTSIVCTSVHPGGVHTEISRGILKSYPFLAILNWIQKYVLISASQGSITQLYAATTLDPEIKNLKGAYLVPYAKLGRKSNLASDPDGNLGQQFWNLCEALIREKVHP